MTKTKDQSSSWVSTLRKKHRNCCKISCAAKVNSMLVFLLYFIIMLNRVSLLFLASSCELRFRRPSFKYLMFEWIESPGLEVVIWVESLTYSRHWLFQALSPRVSGQPVSRRQCSRAEPPRPPPSVGNMTARGSHSTRETAWQPCWIQKLAEPGEKRPVWVLAPPVLGCGVLDTWSFLALGRGLCPSWWSYKNCIKQACESSLKTPR